MLLACQTMRATQRRAFPSARASRVANPMRVSRAVKLGEHKRVETANHKPWNGILHAPANSFAAAPAQSLRHEPNRWHAIHARCGSARCTVNCYTTANHNRGVAQPG